MVPIIAKCFIFAPISFLYSIFFGLSKTRGNNINYSCTNNSNLFNFNCEQARD